MNVRADFPAYKAEPGLAYLDSAATALKPYAVIEAVAGALRGAAPVGRSSYPRAESATEAYAAARRTVAAFCGTEAEATVFTRSATESANLVAAGFPLESGDEVIVSGLEHHSALLPWQRACGLAGANLRTAPHTVAGEIDIDDLERLISARTRVIAVSAASNVFGTSPDPARLAALAAGRGAALVLDASQWAPHRPLPWLAAYADAFFFSFHKCYGPDGAGVLAGKRAFMERLAPLLLGGGMLRGATLQTYEPAMLPERLEAGSPNLAAVVGAAAAAAYLSQIVGMEAVQTHTSAMTRKLKLSLQAAPGVRVLGIPDPSVGIVGFTLDGVHPHDAADILGRLGVCVRAGQHCAMPLHAALDLPASLRASVGVYTEEADVLALIAGLGRVRRVLHA